MTKKEVLDELKQDFSEEMHDCNKYLDMAKAMRDDHEGEMSEGLYLIAHDEFTHAEFIKKCLMEEGFAMTEDERQKWQDLKERHNHIFRG